MSKPRFYQERLNICVACPHYVKAGHRCLKVAKPGHPSKIGYLDHPYGLPNPRTACPLGKWGYIISDKIQTLICDLGLTLDNIPKPILDTLVKAGVNPYNELDLMIALHRIVKAKCPTTIITRGYILKQLQLTQR